MGGRVDVNQSAGGMLENHKYVDDAKSGGHCDAEITGDNSPRMIAKKS